VQRFTSNEKERENFIQGLKHFRPSQTIFEVDTAPSKKSLVEVMSIKRKKHSKIIQRSQKKKEIEMSSNSSSNEIPEDLSEITAKFHKRALDGEIEDKKAKKLKSFKDEQYYMKSLPDNHFTEKAFSVGNNLRTYNDISFEVGGDDNISVKKGQKVKKWDRRKKKICLV